MWWHVLSSLGSITLHRVLPIWCISTNSVDCLASSYAGIMLLWKWSVVKLTHEMQQLLFVCKDGWVVVLFIFSSPRTKISETRVIKSYLRKQKQMLYFPAVSHLLFVTFYIVSNIHKWLVKMSNFVFVIKQTSDRSYSSQIGVSF